MSETVNVPEVAVTPVGINHLVLNVRDLEESHHFWSDLLGFKRVGIYRQKDPTTEPLKMWFYSGVANDDVNHHDLALIERKGLTPPAARWDMMAGVQAVNHIAIGYPNRSAWMEQLAFLDANGVRMNLRIDHGMTHSMYIEDPNGYGVEVLYELPEEVWRHDIDGALSYADIYPNDLLTDTTDYVTNFD